MAIKKKSAESDLPQSVREALISVLEEVITDIPESTEGKSAVPERAARELTHRAARKSAALTGVMALPAGPVGVLTILPDLIGVWHLQAQLVADTAAVYGKAPKLTREILLACLFQHMSDDAFYDILARSGHRLMVRRLGRGAMSRLILGLAGKIARRIARRVIYRWMPLIGAWALSAYSYRDTQQVGKTAEDYFAN